MPVRASVVDRPDGHAGVANKATLATISAAMENIALDSAHEATVVALFQRGAHFARRADAYRTLAERGATVIAAYAGEPVRVDDVTQVRLADDDALVAEWGLVVLTPNLGAYVSATDLDRFDPTQGRLEDGRTFAATWGFDRTGAARHLARMSRTLGSRLPPLVAGKLAAALLHGHKAPVSPAERAFGRAALHLTDAPGSARREVVELRHLLGHETMAATHDPLTGLTNREGLARWSGGPGLDGVETLTVGLVMIDLDDFARVNDTYGHTAGDELLRDVAGALEHACRPGDLVARWGGDEFVVACPGADGAELSDVAHRLLDAVAEVRVHGQAIRASAGTRAGRRRPLPIDDADAALLEAKRAGGRRVVAFDAAAV